MYSASLGIYNPATNMPYQEEEGKVQVTGALRNMILQQASNSEVSVHTLIKIMMAKKDLHLSAKCMDAMALQFEAMNLTISPLANPFEHPSIIHHGHVDTILGTNRVFTAREVERACVLANMCKKVGGTLLKTNVACAIAEHFIKFSKHVDSSRYLSLLPITSLTESECVEFHKRHVSNAIEIRNSHIQAQRAQHVSIRAIAPKETTYTASSSSSPPQESVENLDSFFDAINDVLNNASTKGFAQVVETEQTPKKRHVREIPPINTQENFSFLPEGMSAEDLASTITLDDVNEFITEELIRCNNATSIIMGDFESVDLPHMNEEDGSPPMPKRRKYESMLNKLA